MDWIRRHFSRGRVPTRPTVAASASARASMILEPLSAKFGAQVLNIDIARSLSLELIQRLQRALSTYRVLILPEQTTDPAVLHRFALQLGTPEPSPFLPGLPHYPSISKIVKAKGQADNVGGTWHSSGLYWIVPPVVTLLQAVDVPNTGGETEFADQVNAYNTLPLATKERIDVRQAVHLSGEPAAYESLPRRENPHRGRFRSQLPMVFKHPRSSSVSLRINRAHTDHIVGMERQESDDLLGLLFEHQERPQFVIRHAWDRGTLMICDDRFVIRRALNNYPGGQRTMHRILLKSLYHTLL